MSFTNPNALFLLLLLPVFVAVGWPRLAYRRRRDATSLVIRLVLVVLVILGLSGIQIQRTADKLAVVFLLDGSDSIPPTLQSAAVEYVRQATDLMEESDQAAVVVFGADALVEIPMTEQLELVQIGSDPIRLNTDLAEAMRVGLALFPADTAKRMVVLSDGKQTLGDAQEVARLAAATNVQVDYVALLPEDPALQVGGPEMMIVDVDVPTTVNEGEQFNLAVTLSSNRSSGSAELRILSGGRLIHNRDIELPLGTTNEVFEIVAPSAGFVDFQVMIEPRSADTFYQNNQLSAFTEVTGPPRVLIVTSDERESESLRTVLSDAGLLVDVQGPRDLPIGLAPLSSYDCIVLTNISATELTSNRMNYLQAYVRDLGGGLVVVGGPNSYGVGGYFDTPLEETLPVEMRLKDQERIPQLTMLFVIDRSGSMEISSTGTISNLELAKEAVVRSFDLLSDTDRTGVLSFDLGASYVVEIQTVGNEANRAILRDRVGSLRPGGGTNIRQGLQSADEVLSTDPSALKHIILLTDGGADQSGIIPAVDRMYQNYGITTSVVAVGQEYMQWLQDVAMAGNGQFHLVHDVTTIPAIFTSETLLATRSYIVEEPFTPVLTARHAIMAGFDSVPQLDGYVATSDKETSTVILRGPDDDPLLATWQYGLGRSVAFTSDASSRWAENWLGWGGYADFWNNVIRWTISSGSTNNVEARVIERGEDAIVVVDVRDTRGDYLNGLQIDAAVVSASLDRFTLDLHQTAPGRYAGSFTPLEEGAYFITVAGSTVPDGDALQSQSIVQSTGWVLSYSAEYRVEASELERDAPLNLLRELADITGGSSVKDDAADAFLHDLDQERAAQPVWQYFILAALLLLPFDVAVRRLVITQSDLERLRAFLTRRPPVESEQPSARMGRLMTAKTRARDKLTESREDDASPVAERVPPKPAVSPEARYQRRYSPPRATASRPAQSAQKSEGTLASKLLDRRREKHDSQDES